MPCIVCWPLSENQSLSYTYASGGTPDPEKLA